MSRRKQSKPRAVVIHDSESVDEMEQSSLAGTTEGAVVPSKDRIMLDLDITDANQNKDGSMSYQLKSPTSDTSSSGGADQKSSQSKHSSSCPSEDGGGKDPAEDALGTATVAMETNDVAVETTPTTTLMMMMTKKGVGDEDDEEIYKCDICGAAFTGIADFMDHRNYDCETSMKDSMDCETGKDVESSEKLSCSDDDIGDLQLPGEEDADPNSPFMLEHKGIVGNINGSLPYPCQFCDKAFSRLSYLKRHEQVHSDKMPFKCTFCSRLFKHKRSRDRHIKLHTGDKKYHCPSCESSFSRSDHLKIHIKTHNISKPYPCLTCNRGYTTSAALGAHTQNCHKSSSVGGKAKDKEFKCVQCTMTFSTSQSLQDHLLIHLQQDSGTKSKAHKSNVCIYCSESFSNKQALAVHLEVAHIANKKHKCDVCYEAFLSEDLLQSHAEKHRESPNEPQQFNCPYCPKISYPSLAVLNIHLSTMHGDKPLQTHSCNQCGKEYPSLYNLSEHISAMHEQDMEDGMESPEGATAYTCGYCTVQFASSALLHGHVKSVHSVPNMISCDEDGNLRCPKCSLGFAGETALEDHLKNVHGVTDMPPLPSSLHCPHCSKSFANHNLLQEHVHRSHKKPMDKMKYPCPYCIKQNLFDSIEQLQLHVEVYHKSDRAPVYLCPEGNCKAHFNTAEDLSCHLQEDHRQGNDSGPVASSSALMQSYTKVSNVKKDRQAKSPSIIPKENSTPMDGAKATPPKSESPSEGSFGCPSCHNEFPNEEQLVVHVLTHYKSISAEYVCKDCGKSFKKPDELQKHLFEIHAHHLYKCSLCKEVFDSKVSIQVHFAVKHSNECKLYSCIKCGVVYRTEGDLLVHVKFEHLKIPQPFKCIFCCQSFTSDVEFQCHLTSHSEQYRCPFCNAPYASQESLEVHLHATHDYLAGGGGLPLLTEVNSKPINGNAQETRSKPVKAQNSKNSQSKSGVFSESKGEVEEGCFVCKICDQKFPLKIILEKHHLSEHDIKARSATIKSEMTSSLTPPMDLSNGKAGKFGCDKCSEKFKSKYELLKHVNSHSSSADRSPRASPTGSNGSKPGSPPASWPCMCYVCKHPIRIETEFLSHAQQHNNEISGPNNTIRCIACLQLLNSMVELQLHARYHTQAPPISGVQELYPCYVCGKTFGSRTDVVPKLDGSGRPCFMCISCIKTSLEAQFMGVHSTSAVQYPVANGGNRCPTCSVKFESYEELEAHLPTHGNNKTYQCIKCQQNFATEAEIQLHVTSHVIAEGIHLECKLCNKVFDSPAKLQCHLVEHTFPDKEYRCPVCLALFSCPVDIQGHAIDHGIESRHHKCSQCSQTFFFTAELQNHILSHPSAEDLYPCSECPRTFSSASNLTNHLRIHDTKDKKLKCSLCPMVFYSTADMQQHFFQVHSESEFGAKKKSFKCGQCSKSFPCLSNLQGHQRIHSDGKKFTCTECGKVFALARNLTIHTRSHSGEKPYQCPVCEKRFARKENRKVHLKSHSGVKPFMCPHCAKMFSRKCHVREHMRTHSNSATRVANYQCDICNETFTLSKNLRRHMRRIHKVDEIPVSMVTAAQSQSSASTSPNSLLDEHSSSIEDNYGDVDDGQSDDGEAMCTEAIVSSSQDLNQGLNQPDKVQSE